MKSNVKAHALAQLESAVLMNSLAPRRRASSFFDGLWDIAYVSAPRAEAQRRPKCPRPPLERGEGG